MKVWGFTPFGLRVESCVKTKFMGNKPTLKIILRDGSELVCTPDHLIMTRVGWKEACMLTMEDSIAGNMIFPRDVIGDDEKYWELVSNNLNLEMITMQGRIKTLAFARILGYILAKPLVNFFMVSFETEDDLVIFLDDMRLLISDYTPLRHGKYTCLLPKKFITWISFLEGNLFYEFPKFIHDAPMSFIKEFLGGLIGGNGVYDHAREIIKFDTLPEKMSEIQTLLKKVGVGYRDPNYTIFNFDIYEFSNIIGIKYSINKQTCISKIITYHRMIKYQDNPVNISNWIQKIGDPDVHMVIPTIFRNAPVYYLPIDQIIPWSSENVYDITVENVSSFVANGLIVHNCGIVYSQVDMPFTSEGITPDLILNPNCIPSRMTINQLLECILGKSCCMEGEYGDSTAFVENDSTEQDVLVHDPTIAAQKLADELGMRLSGNGYSRKGEELMYCGFTGQVLGNIFIGPVYYQRLKHLVSDKMHARAQGPVTTFTRQPLEGRSKDGGLKFGEMERDSIIAHGASKFLKERLCEQSDPYKIVVCNKCGNFATTQYKCNACQTDLVSVVDFPYSSKLLVQELQAMCIKTKIDVGN